MHTLTLSVTDVQTERNSHFPAPFSLGALSVLFSLFKAELQSFGCTGGKQAFDHMGTPHFSKVHVMPLHFYERPILVPVFNN